MSNRLTGLPPEVPGDPRQRFWFAVLNMFPFVFLPLAAAIAILASVLMPYLRRFL